MLLKGRGGADKFGVGIDFQGMRGYGRSLAPRVKETRFLVLRRLNRWSFMKEHILGRAGHFNHVGS